MATKRATTRSGAAELQSIVERLAKNEGESLKRLTLALRAKFCLRDDLLTEDDPRTRPAAAARPIQT